MTTPSVAQDILFGPQHVYSIWCSLTFTSCHIQHFFPYQDGNLPIVSLLPSMTIHLYRHKNEMNMYLIAIAS